MKIILSDHLQILLLLSSTLRQSLLRVSVNKTGPATVNFIIITSVPPSFLTNRVPALAVKPGARLLHQLQEEGVAGCEDEVSVGDKTTSTGNTVLQVVSLGQGHRVQVGVPTSVPGEDI